MKALTSEKQASYVNMNIMETIEILT